MRQNADVFELLAEPRPVDGHDRLLDAAPGYDGTLVTLWTTDAGAALLTARTESPGGASFPLTRAAEPVSARVVRFGPELREVVPIHDLTIAFPSVRLLPDGAVLVVGHRCRWSASGPEHNAMVVLPDGTVERTGVLGDGIEDVAVSPSGDIWVSFFDEGVFGNFGWGGAGPEPIGHPGIVRFDRALRPTWTFDGPGMADCYALTLAGDTAWACYYTDFPIARIADGHTTLWRNEEIAGAKALAVDGERVALYGGYSGERERLAIGRLTADRYLVERIERVPLPGSGRLALFGLGAELHVVVGGSWYVARPFG